VQEDIRRLAEELKHKPHTTAGYAKDRAYCEPDPKLCHREDVSENLLVRHPGKSHPSSLLDGIKYHHTRFYFETCGHCGTFYNPYAHQALAEFKASRQRYNVTLGHAIEALGGLVDDE
jgi:hypothetical protein